MAKTTELEKKYYINGRELSEIEFIKAINKYVNDEHMRKEVLKDTKGLGRYL